jgi:DNA-binding response OmpR family regulator
MLNDGNKNSSGQPIRVLIIEDDAQLGDALSVYLTRAGYEVKHAPNGDEGLRSFSSHPADLVILDVMMPGLDGWEVCRRLRQVSEVPIIILTARGHEQDRILGLSIGADDYMAKPFSLKELAARAAAVLRRTHGRQPQEVSRESSILFSDDRLTIDGLGWEVLRDGQPVELTATERKLLFYLVENKGRVVTPEQILEHVWGPAYVDQPDYVKLYVWRVRQKIEDDPSAPHYVLTERGLGYRFARVPDNGKSPVSPEPVSASLD